jgi:hypothetical protein
MRLLFRRRDLMSRSSDRIRARSPSEKLCKDACGRENDKELVGKHKAAYPSVVERRAVVVERAGRVNRRNRISELPTEQPI